MASRVPSACRLDSSRGPNQHAAMVRRLCLVVLALVALGGLAVPAIAHVELEGEQAVAGSTAALTFSFHHGREGMTTSEATTTAAPTTTTTNDLPRTALEAESRDDGGGSLAPWVIGSGLAALVAIAVGGGLLKRRMG